MDQIVIATAGHVDHGKTTLIKTLTGVDTDTTEEEKRRGLTINLGFTYFKLPNNQRVGIVDVPGHEKFLKNMIAGLTGVDMVLLVIDANEGVMPQTIEHASILRLLGITNFIIVFSKVDTVDDEMLSLAIEDFKESFSYDPVLVSAPIIRTDAVSGTGIDELITFIQNMASKVPERVNLNTPRMNIDRTFTLKGVGTVITGTLLEGNVTQGDDLTIYPENLKVHVKQVRTYDKSTNTALVGQRAALNVNAPSKTVSRGDVIAKNGSVEITDEINVSLRTLTVEDNDLSLNTRIRFYVGSTEVLGRVFPLGTNELSSHGEYFVQIRLEKPVVVKYGDKFIIRTYSPMRTIAGGKILQIYPVTRRRFDEDVLKVLNVRKVGHLPEIISDFSDNSHDLVIDSRAIARIFNQNERNVIETIDQLVRKNKVISFANLFLNRQRLLSYETLITDYLKGYHDKYPLRLGVTNSDLKANLKDKVSSQDIDITVSYSIKNGRLKLKDDYYSLKPFEPTLSTTDQQIRIELNQELMAAGVVPASMDDLIKGDSQKSEVLRTMFHGEAIVLDGQYVMLTKYYRQVSEQVRGFIENHGPLSLADYRDITGSSRKYAMIVLERMDKDGITVRIDNKRIIKQESRE